MHVIVEQIKQLEEIFPEQNPSGAAGCEPSLPQLQRETQKGCRYSNAHESLPAGWKRPEGHDQIEGRDLSLLNCLPTK